MMQGFIHTLEEVLLQCSEINKTNKIDNTIIFPNILARIYYSKSIDIKNMNYSITARIIYHPLNV